MKIYHVEIQEGEQKIIVRRNKNGQTAEKEYRFTPRRSDLIALGLAHVRPAASWRTVRSTLPINL